MTQLIINLQGSLANPNLALEAAKRNDLASLPPSPTGRIDLRAFADAQASGVAATCITVGHVVGPGDPVGRTRDDLRSWQDFFQCRGSDIPLVLNAGDIEQCASKRQPGIILGFQNTEMLAEDVANIQDFAQLGVRVMQLTYNAPNSVGCGCLSPEDTGLTRFGRQAVEAMNDCGVLVDLSHAGPVTLKHAIDASRKPIAVSHTACRSLVDNPRNVLDEELRLIAKTGGVVGIFAMPFLRASGQPHLVDYIRHIKHALNVAGEDHVAIGTDGTVTAVDDVQTYRHYLSEAIAERKAAGVAAPGEVEAVTLFLPDMTGPTQFSTLADELTKQALPASTVDKVLGLNWLRLLTEVWPSGNHDMA